MEISTKYREVQVWLERLLAGGSFPQFERNEQTIELLYELMKKNMAHDQATQLVIQDLRQKTIEYTAEGQRLAAILSSLNLTVGSLSHSGVMSVRMLANLAFLLQIRDTSETSYLSALQSLQDDCDKTHEACLSEEQLLSQLSNKTKDALVKYTSLNKAYQDLQHQSSEQRAEIEKRAKTAAFLQSKAREYTQLIKKLKENCLRSGAEPSLFHENLVKKAENLQKLKDELDPLRRKLQNYHDLPPDISEAKVKVVELKHKISELEAELAKKIDLMRL